MAILTFVVDPKRVSLILFFVKIFLEDACFTLFNLSMITCILDTIMPQLLEALCVGDPDVEKQLSVKQALSKQFAEILHFTLQFDDLKVRNNFHLVNGVCEARQNIFDDFLKHTVTL